jgi:hypothetical protein
VYTKSSTCSSVCQEMRQAPIWQCDYVHCYYVLHDRVILSSSFPVRVSPFFFSLEEKEGNVRENRHVIVFGFFSKNYGKNDMAF